MLCNWLLVGGKKRKRGRRHRNLELGANIGMNGGVNRRLRLVLRLTVGGEF